VEGEFTPADKGRNPFAPESRSRFGERAKNNAREMSCGEKRDATLAINSISALRPRQRAASIINSRGEGEEC
jgi:hypothetical protein